MLSGDSAVLVAMAVHRLPLRQRRAALILGISGAVVLQTLATLAMAQLLRIPLLLCVGGVLLCGVALNLLREEEEEEETPQVHAAEHLEHAVWTILVATLLTSLDNVLAVASVGQGHPGLILFGLLFSSAILITGSLFISQLMNRYPILVTVGAGILAWTAGGMIEADAVVRRIMWAPLGAGLPHGPFRFLFSVVATVLVLIAPNWRK